MELMVNPQITDFRQDVNGDIKMLKLGTKQEDAYANIIGQAEGADLDNNKTATINVSTYTDPVEITPTSGKDGMKKATVTLSNIPEVEANRAYSANYNPEIETYPKTIEITPTKTKYAGMAKVTLEILEPMSIKLFCWKDTTDQSKLYYTVWTEENMEPDAAVYQSLNGNIVPTQYGVVTIGGVGGTSITFEDNSQNSYTATRYSTGDVTFTGYTRD